MHKTIKLQNNVKTSKTWGLNKIKVMEELILFTKLNTNKR